MTTENFIYFFSTNVKKIMRKENLLQKQLASKLGISPSMVGAIVEGRTLSILSVYKVSRVFNYTIDELITTLI